MNSRREFMQSVSLGALALTMPGLPWDAARAAGAPGASTSRVAVDKLVSLRGDAVPTRLEDYPRKLLALMDGRSDVNDFYLAEGAVGELETQFAKILGKEDAAFMPTGTMANQIAVRILCGERRHLLLQKESHVYRDESDAVAILSGINPVPLDGDTPDALYQSTVAAFGEVAEDAYPVKVGAVSLESPVRRLDGATVPLATIEKISALAKSKGAGMHLDGARLFLMCGSVGFDVKRYCAPFDTVYVSLYKYFGAPFGAILAGDKAAVAKARDLRHIFGGTIFHGWIAALVALDGLDGFEQRFARARKQGDALLGLLGDIPGITVRRVEHGSNIAFLQLDKRIENGLADRLEKAGIVIGRIKDGRLQLTINETILRKPAASIAAAFSP
jgi:threonine aldolase